MLWRDGRNSADCLLTSELRSFISCAASLNPNHSWETSVNHGERKTLTYTCEYFHWPWAACVTSRGPRVVTATGVKGTCHLTHKRLTSLFQTTLKPDRVTTAGGFYPLSLLSYNRVELQSMIEFTFPSTYAQNVPACLTDSSHVPYPTGECWSSRGPKGLPPFQ